MKFALALIALVVPLARTWGQQLECQPCNDHYGRVDVGSSKQRYLQLKNTGSRSLRINSKSVTGAAFAFGDFPLPVNLAAGASTRLPVVFTPVATGKNTGTITLASNAKNRTLSIGVYGVGVGAEMPHLGVNPTSLDFGNVAVGSSASLPITLTATKAAVTVATAQLDSPEFSLPGLVLPLIIAAGQNAQITVQFAPTASGTAFGKLTLISNADNSPNVVTLTGVGIVTGPHSTDLSWDASQDPVIGYNVYRGSRHGGPYSAINPVLDSSTRYTDGEVNAGGTYFYVVTAVNADNQESAYSNEVQVVIPNP